LPLAAHRPAAVRAVAPRVAAQADRGIARTFAASVENSRGSFLAKTL
jgi:hypothetical protein